MFSQRTPTNNSANNKPKDTDMDNSEQQVDPMIPPKSFLKKVAGYVFYGSVPKRRHTSNASSSNGIHCNEKTPTDGSGGDETRKPSDVITMPTYEIKDLQVRRVVDLSPDPTISHVIKSLAMPVSTPLSTPGNENAKANAFKATRTAAFIVGSSGSKRRGSTSNNTSFTRIKLASNMKKGASTNNMGTRKAAHVMQPATKRRVYAFTPYRISRHEDGTSARCSEQRNGTGNGSAVNSKARGKIYKPCSRILTGINSNSIGPLGSLSKVKSNDLFIQMQRNGSLGNGAGSLELRRDNAVYQNPVVSSTTQSVAGVKLVHVRNSEHNTSIQSSPGTSEIIHNRRESTINGYWSRDSDHVESSIITSPTATNMNPKKMNETLPSRREYDQDDNNDGGDIAPYSKEREKIGFQTHEPPKAVDVKSPDRNMARSLAHKEPPCITVNGDGNHKVEREDGRIRYAMETFYGQNFDYQKTFGKSSKGVEDNESTKRIVSEVVEGINDGTIPIVRFFKKTG